MKKNEIIAMQNRLEYLKDRVQRQEKDLERYKTGLEELQKASEILLKHVALELGGEDHSITMTRRDDLGDWEAVVVRNDNGSLKVHLKKKEKE